MNGENVKTVLLVTSSGTDALFPFLFEFTKYWATQGRQLLYISKTRIESLPPSLANAARPDAHILKLMQFMYLPTWSDVLYQLATIRIRRFRVTAIVVDNLADYFAESSGDGDHPTSGDHVSHVCASLLHAAIMTSAPAFTDPVALVCGYSSSSSTIDQTVVKNFFHNVWQVASNHANPDKTVLTVTKRSADDRNEEVSFTYEDDHEYLTEKDRSRARLRLTETIRKILGEE